MSSSLKLERLIEAFTCLPGVGRKSAQRMALYLLERDRPGADELAQSLVEAMQGIKHCQQCRDYSDEDLCRLCSNRHRNDDVLCIVETPADVLAIEATGQYQGRYFVLLGRLSPLDGIGPEQIGMDRLEARLRQGPVQELILATNPTIEGEVTAQYIADLAGQYEIRCSRIAHGVPLGGELEYIDGSTLAHALSGRIPFTSPS